MFDEVEMNPASSELSVIPEESIVYRYETVKQELCDGITLVMHISTFQESITLEL